MVMVVPENEALGLSTEATDLGIECFDIGVVRVAGADPLVRYS